MRNPRRLRLSGQWLRANNLSGDPPPGDSLFWKMWNACIPIANQALNTDFIQGIKGTLDPVKYGAFNVSDGYYCFNGAQCYLDAESRAQDAQLKAFLYAKYESYLEYDESFTTIWHLRDARGIVPIPECVQYSDYEDFITSHEDPVYSIPLMIPCEYLWYWLASQLTAYAVPGNLYKPWIDGNGSPDGAYAMGNFLAAYQAAHPGEIDESKAIGIYAQAMKYEYENFAAATA